MKVIVVLTVMISLYACAASPPSNDTQSEPQTTTHISPQASPDAPEAARPVISPHGYIITKDSDLGRFGGFVGECTDDHNWPYYWQCMSENAGNGGFK